MNPIEFAKEDPVNFWFFVGMFLLITVVMPYMFYSATTSSEAQRDIIENASCYDLKKMIANMEFKRSMMSEAEHVYEWRCEK